MMQERQSSASGALLGELIKIIRQEAAPGGNAMTLRQRERRQQMNIHDARVLQSVSLETPTDLGSNAVQDISGALSILLAEVFALYLKTKNFHWHMSGSHFRDYHRLLDEQAEEIFATTDAIAERVRKVGGTTLRSIGRIGRLQRLLDNDGDYVMP
jgi:starvation-inducible DNA-binding protein